MHHEARQFVEWALDRFQADTEAVCELGSYNVNGTIRESVDKPGSWHGIDKRRGPCVDEVIDACEWDGKGEFTLCISMEALEHAPDREGLILSAYRALRPGGLFILTCAGPGRVPHNNDGVWNALAPGEHYANVSISELNDWFCGAGFEILWLASRMDDSYAVGRKP